MEYELRIPMSSDDHDYGGLVLVKNRSNCFASSLLFALMVLSTSTE